MVYGGIPPFYYWEPPTNDPLAGLALLVFVLFNQAWFMGAFFLLAGYFTPGSFDRKGPGVFLKDRLLRLGIPLLIWIFVLNPISSIGYFQMPASLTGNTAPLTWQVYPYLLGLGPLWFIVQTTGGTGIDTEFVAKDLDELNQLIFEKINRIDGVQRTETEMFLNYIKRQYDWGTALD